jgi:hypothetical protein
MDTDNNTTSLSSSGSIQKGRKMKKSGIRLALTGALMVLPLLAAAFAVVADEPAEIPAFTVESTSEGIDIPDTLPAGLVTLTVENNNEATIAPILARLNEDVTLDQFMEALSQGPEAAIPLVSLLGGTEIEPEESFTITFDFQPGDHVLLEFNSEIPVIEPFTVVGDEAEEPAELEDADVAVSMVDYLYGLPMEIEAGLHSWSIENAGEQWHELSIARVEEGATIDDVMAAFMAEESGEEPEIAVEETFFFAPLSAGEHARFDLELEPGRYLVVCFLPSMEDGEPHAAHGMYQFITVAEA